MGWMIFPRKAHPVIYDRILDASRQAAVSPVELHHYVAPQETVQLITENFGVAFMTKGVAEQIPGSRDCSPTPFAASLFKSPAIWCCVPTNPQGS